MKKLVTIIMLLLTCKVYGQVSVNAYPQQEFDSTWTINGNYALQYSIQHHYNAACLDTFQEFSNASGPVMHNTLTWPSGTSNQFPIGRSPETRPRISINQHYNNGVWENYVADYQMRYSNACIDNILYLVYWTGNAWNDTVVGLRGSASFTSNGPSTWVVNNYDNGYWFNYQNKTYFYDATNTLRSVHYRQYSQPNATTYTDYVDSNFSFYSYNGFCNYKIDSMIT